MITMRTDRATQISVLKLNGAQIEFRKREHHSIEGVALVSRVDNIVVAQARNRGDLGGGAELWR